MRKHLAFKLITLGVIFPVQSCFIPVVPPVSVQGKYELVEKITNGKTVPHDPSKTIEISYVQQGTRPGYTLVTEKVDGEVITERRAYKEVDDRKMARRSIVIYEYEDSTFQRFKNDYSPDKSEIIVYDIVESPKVTDTPTHRRYRSVR